MVIIRLILVLILAFSLSYLETWFTISFSLFYFDISIIQIFIILLILYLTLECQEYYYKKANEFHQFFFWFIYIICVFILYISYIKVFILTEYICDFLIQWKYFKIQIIYSFKYKIIFFEDTLNILSQLSPMSDKKRLIVLENVRKATDYTIFEQKITLDRIQNYAAAYIHFASEVYDFVLFFKKDIDIMLFKQSTLYQLYIFFRNTLIIFIGIKVSILFYCNMFIKFYLTKHLYKYVFSYIAATKPYILSNMPEDVILDKCKGVAELLIKRWGPLDVVQFYDIVNEFLTNISNDLD